MNEFITKLSNVSPNHFGFYSGGEYIVCVADYLRTVPDFDGTAYVDGYYEVSNSQYHKAREFIAFCKSRGCIVEVEREKSYKDFLFDNGFFGRGKNSLLYDKQFGSKIYFTVLKVTKMPADRNSRLEVVKFLQILKSKAARFKSDADTCGSCSSCIAACPQKAIPNSLENCLRTHMQEGRIDKSFSAALGTRVLGCEICSEVCPKNKKIAISENPPLKLQDFLELVEKKDPALCEKYGKNIISKNKLIPFILNAMGNLKDLQYKDIIEKYTTSENENIKNAALLAKCELDKNIKNAALLAKGELGENIENVALLAKGELGENIENAALLAKGELDKNIENAALHESGKTSEKKENESQDEQS